MQEGVPRHEPLYLKYRPQSLKELVGQEAVVRTLANAINHDRLVHAYLFTGPRGTGKTSTARILAKSLNCEGGASVDPCLACTSCDEIRRSIAPDVIEIDAASNNSVDDARVLIERAPLAPMRGRHKIYIIDECHMLTREAFNALLKTIEEPPRDVFFILATTEEHKVPPTIVSRCQKLMFRLVNQGDLAAYLSTIAAKEQISIEKQALDVIARRCGGGLRDALGLLDQASLLANPGEPVSLAALLALLGAVEEDTLLSLSQAIADRRGDRVLSLVLTLIAEGREPAVLVMELARHFLNLTKASYLSEAGGTAAGEAGTIMLGSRQYIEQVIEQAKAFDRGELSQIVEQLNRLEQTTRRSSQPALQLEMGLLAICHRHDIQLVRQLAERIAELEKALSDGRLAPAREPLARPAAAPAQKSGPAADVQSGEPAGSSAPPVPRAEEARAAGEAAGGDGKQDAGAGSACWPEPESGRQSGAAALPAPESVAEGSGAESDIDAFWSDILSELQASAPSVYGVLSTYPFPLKLDSREFVIGVTTDMWKTNIEKRLEPIKSACEKVCGRQLAVRVKVAGDAPVRPQARERAGEPRAAAAARSGARDRCDDDTEPEPAGGADSPAPAAQAGARVVSGRAAQAVADSATDQSGSSTTTVREAYKLFEGPGSRLIG